MLTPVQTGVLVPDSCPLSGVRLVAPPARLRPGRLQAKTAHQHQAWLTAIIRKFGALSALACAVIATPSHAGGFTVSFETEAPGMQTTSATVFGGVETFNTQPIGTGKSFATHFGTGGNFTGIYANVQINPTDMYGGAGGNGEYAVAFPSNSYTLDLTTTQPGGVTYFGYWLSALDAGNQALFYKNGQLLFDFMPSDLIHAIAQTPNPAAYYGNPNVPYYDWNRPEPYAFVNFFATGGTSFDRVVFKEVNFAGGYESDNHTIGQWSDMGTGTVIPLQASIITAPVPEPDTWLMMTGGLAIIGIAVHRHKTRQTAVA